MKKSYNLLSFSLLAISLCILSLESFSQHQSANNDGLMLEVRSDKTGFSLGEAVTLNVHVKNTSNSQQSISREFDTLGGALSVFISSDGRSYKEYKGPMWGTADRIYPDYSSAFTEIMPGNETPNSTIKILYNDGVKMEQFSHLNPQAAQTALRGFNQIETDYAFSVPGRYFIKVVFHNATVERQSLTSSPFEITILEPQQSDADIWKLMKSDPDIGYFLHMGFFDDKVRKSQKLQTGKFQKLEKALLPTDNEEGKNNVLKKQALDTIRQFKNKNLIPNQLQ